MSDLLLNLDTALPQRPKKSSEGNKKHQRFVRRRHFLERKGFLKQKQLPAQAPLPKRDASHGGAGVDQERDKKKQKASRGGAGVDQERDKKKQKASCGGAGVDQERDKKKQKASCGGARVDQERDKKKQKVDRQDSLFGQDRVGKEDGALREDGSAQQAEMRKGTANHCAKDSGPTSCPPSKAPPVTSRMGGASARQNGAWVSCSAGEKASLLSEFESGLSAVAPAVTKPNKMVAVDCEMVGTGPGGRNSELARCSVVSYHGDLMYDKFIRPVNPITNFRTRWSGIRRHHMRNAVPFKAAQKEILKLLSGKIVIGHAIHNDFKALKYYHPKSLTRDTSKIPLLNRKAGFPETEVASLKRLTKQLLHRDIQVGQHGHSSIEDAQATMELYKLVEAEWERHLALPPAQD